MTIVDGAVAQNAPEPQALAAVKRQASELLSRIPDYACLETIERDWRRPGSGRHRDVVRVQVILAGGKETFSWPGRVPASNDDLQRLVGYGLSVTGLFAGFAHNLFVSTVPEIGPPVRESVDGLPALRYDFSVPVAVSAWRVSWSGVSGMVGERGSFWVNESTLRLLRLEMNADEIPASLACNLIRIIIDYSAGTVSGARVLVPSSAEVWTRETSGGLDHDRIFFSQCRKFTAQSVVAFESTGDSQSGPQLQDFQLPAGLEIPLTLAEEINSAHAIVGDPVRATVAKDVIWKKRKLIPQGSVLTGHLRRFEPVTGLEKYLIVLEFDQVQTNSGTADFFARMQSVDPLPGLTVLAGKSSEATDGMVSNEIPGVSVFLVSAPPGILPAGMRMLWKTENLRTRLSQPDAPDQPVAAPGPRNIDPASGLPH